MTSLAATTTWAGEWTSVPATNHTATASVYVTSTGYSNTAFQLVPVIEGIFNSTVKETCSTCGAVITEMPIVPPEGYRPLGAVAAPPSWWMRTQCDACMLSGQSTASNWIRTTSGSSSAGTWIIPQDDTTYYPGITTTTGTITHTYDTTWTTNTIPGYQVKLK